MVSSTFLSSPTQFISTSKLTYSQPPLLSPSTVAFPRISASYASTAKRAATTCSRIAANSSMYDTLGIHMGATFQEIKSAYRKLARISHPDVATGRNDDDKPAADDFIRIHAAYVTLSDPGKRADYDRAICRQQRRPAVVTSSSRFSGYRGRSWETDQCW